MFTKFNENVEHGPRKKQTQNLEQNYCQLFVHAILSKYAADAAVNLRWTRRASITSVALSVALAASCQVTVLSATYSIIALRQLNTADERQGQQQQRQWRRLTTEWQLVVTDSGQRYVQRQLETSPVDLSSTGERRMFQPRREVAAMENAGVENDEPNGSPPVQQG